MTLKLLNKNRSQQCVQNIFIVVNYKNIAFIKAKRKGFWKNFGKKLEPLNDLRNKSFNKIATEA